YLFQDKRIDYAFVIAPNSVYQNWKKEIDIHCPEETNIYIWKVSKDKTFKMDPNKLTFVLMNVEALSHASGKKWLQSKLQKHGMRSMIILDESTSIKNLKASRTKAIIKLGELARFKRILTGSPITKSPLDLFSQCAFLDKKLLGYENFTVFKSKYAVMYSIERGGYSIQIPKYYVNLEELEFKLKNFSYRVRKKDCLDLPEKMYVQRYVDMPEEQQQAYDRLKITAMTVMQDEEVSYNNKLTELLKLQQVTNGFVKTNEGNIIDFKSNAKLKELMAIIEETEDKCIIWANYVHNIEGIKNKLAETYGSDSVVSIYGADSVEDRNQAVEKFQNNDECRFLVGNPTVGGYGLTLTAAKYVIYFSNSYNLEVRQQSEDRAHRIGQKSQVTYIDIICRDTIDQMVLHNLENKIELSAKTLGEQVQKWL
ncbi:MAG: DEAD/DEAH box helicase, partial [Acidimicrobiia bacterium]|nr:DEAD/DEAH box helicase [Acidimicrobiia bacterium]